KSEKFKTISLSMHLRCEDNKEDVVYRKLLRNYLLSGTKKFPNLNSFNKEKLNLYNPFININSYVYGLDRSFVIQAQFTNEKYTEKGMNEKNINFILDVLYNPKINGKKFDKETFEIVKHDYIEDLKSLKDSPSLYSKERLFEEMKTGKFEILNTKEKIELAKKIDETKLYKYYQNLFETNSLDIFICGNFSENKMKKLIEKLIKGNFKFKEKNRYITYDKIIPKPIEIIEKSSTSQSNFAIGLKFKDLTDFERKYVSTIYTGILGISWNSKLLQVVREQNSLCYSIYATKDISRSTLYIYAGIDAENYEKTLKLIKKQTLAMQKGEFTENDILQHIQTYTNSLIEIEDNQMDVMNNLISEILSNTDSVSKRKENISKVTKEDIINIAKKISYDTIYLLKGGK
ncbi:MAG: insulinase family protein, partial [Bacilli bacterium]|nr:insulinase family protein [Bacilli bacterium]